MAGTDSSPTTTHSQYLQHPPPAPPPPEDKNPQQPPSTSTAAGEEPHRRPRGRPPGSKNNPKVPIIVTRNSPNSLLSHVLEFSAGSDIVDSLSDYARRRGRGISVLSATGAVSNVTIKQPGGTVATLRGLFEILSITGTVLPPPALPGAGGLKVFLSGGQGQVVGGSVVRSLVAAEKVVMTTAAFANAVYERIPKEEEAAAVGNDSSTLYQTQNEQQVAASQTSGVAGAEKGSGFQNLGGNYQLPSVSF